jgi:hypothetical protein
MRQQSTNVPRCQTVTQYMPSAGRCSSAWAGSAISCRSA